MAERSLSSLRGEPPIRRAADPGGDRARSSGALAEFFDSADAGVLDRAALASVEPAEWADLTFRFHPSVRRLALEWNTVAVWKALSAEQAPPAPERSAGTVEWLIWRRRSRELFSLTAIPIEITALDAALEGGQLRQVCAALSQRLPDEEIPLRAASLIATWLDSGLLTGLGR